MKTLTIAFALIAFAAAASADGPVVNNASFLAWDHEAASAAETDEYRIYCDRQAGVTADPANLISTVAAPTLQWPISNLQPGQWHCVVSAWDNDLQVESGVSNEIPFVIFAAPTNFRIQ